MPFDWHQFHLDEATSPAVVDSRRRLRICLGGFLLAMAVVFGRAVQLELTQGAAYRAEAARPLRRETSVPGVRGRILARDGTLLAADQEILAVAVHYRYIEQPPDAAWLRRTARRRLSPAERKDPERMAAEEDRVRNERADLARRLAELCGVSPEEWARRAGRIQQRVERIAEGVNRRRADAAAEQPPAPQPRSLLGRLGRMLVDAFEVDDPSPPWITVAEQLDYHVMAEAIPLDVVAEIEGHAERYPGVKIVHRSRREYPNGPLAAQLLGHLGPVEAEQLRSGDRGGRADDGYEPDELVGRMGIERQYESLLRGRRGTAVELTDRSGRILSSHRTREPGVGRDLVLTIDPPLQRAAESLLDDAIERRRQAEPTAEPAGGAIVVLDVHSGEIRAAASAARFDPNLFVAGDSAELAALLRRVDHPLLDRTARMALPPGSVFKTLAAVALLETSAVEPDEPFFCQGYLNRPDRMRCAIYRRQGVGHGAVTLADALAENCNVYFFHHAGRMGSGPLIAWAERFGFGRPTSVDLPGEVAGALPEPPIDPEPATLDGDERAPPAMDGDAMLLAIGQGELTATPLQVARMMAAVANGGRLVTPHVVSRLGLPQREEDVEAEDAPADPIPARPPRPIAGLHGETLADVAQALRRAVDDPRGTAHDTVRLDSVSVAGIAGTAESGGGDHAWFAGYVPAERPKLALVVVLEHAGDGPTAAGPVAQRLIRRMQQLGML